MSEERSAARTLYPGLASSAAPVQDRTAPAPDRSAAQSIYGSPEGGIERARSVMESGVAKPASETEPDGASTDKGEPNVVTTTAFDPTKFEGADPGLISEFGKIATKAAISHETATELMTLHTRTSETYWTNTEKQWASATRADKEIGGDRLDTEVVPAVKELLARRDLIDPEVLNLLVQYRLASNPAIIRSLWRIARALG
jgi:hypothetical protein